METPAMPASPLIETTPILPTVGESNPPSGKPKRPKLFYLGGGVAIILVTLALAISFFGRRTAPSTTSNSGDPTAPIAIPDGFVTYTNTPYFFALSLPPKWFHVVTTPAEDDTLLFQTHGNAVLTVHSFKSVAGSLDDYLSSLGDAHKASRTNTVKVGNYDGVERLESWAAVGTQPVVTYVQIQDQMYIFSLLPTGGKNALTDESLLRDYRAALATFRLTTTAPLGKDWKDYATSPVAELSYPAFTFSHPQSWAITEKSENKNLVVSIYRNNYEISITQAAVGGAVCLFQDSPAFQGSSGDLRDKEYTELTTTSGGIFRRYFNQNQGEKSTFFFCQQEASSPYFATPTQIGGIVYYVPAKYDDNIIAEMDDIIQTITIAMPATPSASP